MGLDIPTTIVQVVKLTWESLFKNDVGLQKFLSDKRIRRRFVAILGLVRYNSNRFKEASYIYCQGYPIQPLRLDKFYQNLDEWLVANNTELKEKEKCKDVVFISGSHATIAITDLMNQKQNCKWYQLFKLNFCNMCTCFVVYGQ